MRQRKIHSRSRLQRGRSGVRIPIKRKGALTEHGYSVKKSDLARHRALSKAVEDHGAESVIHMLQAQTIFRKQKQPTQRAVFEEDREWVEKTFKPDLTPYKAIEAWEAMSSEERAKRRE